RLQAMSGSYFLFPLQLATDFQIRAHSPFADVRDAMREVVASFARSGSRKRLALVVHPLDNGLVNWCRLTARLAEEFGVVDRVLAFEGGLYSLSPLAAADLAARPVRSPERGVVVAGVADEIGLALARAQAMPGVRLCLIGAGDRLTDAADDCWRRGAIVDAVDGARH